MRNSNSSETPSGRQRHAGQRAHSAAELPAAEAPSRFAFGLAAEAQAAAGAAANDARLPRLDQQLCFALYSASLAMTRVYKPLLAQLELTYPQYLVMLVLWQARSEAEPGAGGGTDASAASAVRVSDIGGRLFLDSGTLTPLLKRLERQGLVQRLRGLRDDEREVFIALTDAGLALRQQAARVPQHILASSGCDLPELGRLVQRLAQLRGDLMLQAERAAAEPPRGWQEPPDGDDDADPAFDALARGARAESGPPD